MFAQVDTYDEGGINIIDLEKAIDELSKFNNAKLPRLPKAAKLPKDNEQPFYLNKAGPLTMYDPSNPVGAQVQSEEEEDEGELYMRNQ